MATAPWLSLSEGTPRWVAYSRPRSAAAGSDRGGEQTNRENSAHDIADDSDHHVGIY